MTRLIWTGSSASAPRAGSTRTAACGFATGGCIGSGASPGSAPRSGCGTDTLTIEHAAETLAQYRVAVEPDGRRLREVTAPRFFATGHASPQPFLAPLDETEWHPAQRLAPYRSRRTRGSAVRQAILLEPKQEPHDRRA